MDQVSVSPILDKAVNAKIGKLRDQRKEAINKHDFLRAQEIDHEIEAVKLEAIEQVRDKLRESFKAKVNEQFSNYNYAIDKIMQDFDDQLKTVKNHHHRLFEETQLRQKTDLLNNEREFKDNMTRENCRRIPAHEKILEDARKAATNGQYEQAIAMKEEAHKIAEKDLHVRIENVEKTFINKREMMFDEFKKVLRSMEQKFILDKENVEEKRRQALKAENANYNNQIKATVSKFSTKLVSNQCVKDTNEAATILNQDLEELFEELEAPLPEIEGFYPSHTRPTTKGNSPTSSPGTNKNSSNSSSPHSVSSLSSHDE